MTNLVSAERLFVEKKYFQQIENHNITSISNNFLPIFMKIVLVVIGKTSPDYLKEGIAVFEKRIKRYLSFELLVLSDVKNAKNLKPLVLKEKEGEKILEACRKSDWTVLLDDKGREFTSLQFSKNIEKLMVRGLKTVYFVIGGAYGFSPAVYEKADQKLSLSQMTFSHQLIRLIFVEQLYRAFSILRNEPYHNE